MTMWALFACVFGLSLTGINGCGMSDSHCTFYLTVKSRLTMWRGVFERATINDDESVSIIGQNATIDPSEIILADGFAIPRILTLVNDTLPGPTLIMYENQNITVHVTNRLMSDVVSIHWHGQTQRGTPWMDGAGFITQCPIMPGQTFTYNFIADTIGTHTYHSHVGGKMITGLFGPFIVKKKEPDVYPEHVITIQDYNNGFTTKDYRFRAEYGDVFPDGRPFGGYPTIDKAQTTLYQITSFLINGRGRLYENGVNVTNTPLFVFDVEPNTTYRFRFINSASLYQSRLSIDGHKLTVISMDGNDVENIDNVDSILSHSGERVDFLLHANQMVGNYWIRLNTLINDGLFPAYAILRYNGTVEGSPDSENLQCTSQNICRWVNCPVESFEHVECINVDEMLSVDPSSSAPSVPTSGRFKEFLIHAGFAIYDGIPRANMNGVSFQLPTVSALTQPHHVTNKCSADKYDCGVEKTCECANIIDVDFGDVVQMTIFVRAFGPFFVHHPIHLHGYHFHVIKTGYRPVDPDGIPGRFTPDIDCQVSGNDTMSVCNGATWTNSSWLGGNVPDIRLQRAPLKDTVTVPVGGYVVIRFVADNPGLWHLHCHITFHSSYFGMGLLINDSYSRIPLPPAGFPVCGSYPSPSFMEPKKGDDECTSGGTSICRTTGFGWMIVAVLSCKLFYRT